MSSNYKPELDETLECDDKLKENVSIIKQCIKIENRAWLLKMKIRITIL